MQLINYLLCKSVKTHPKNQTVTMEKLNALRLDVFLEQINV